jgi:DNA polymerase
LTVKPRTIVCLGATAAQALLGRTFRLTKQRGELLESPWSDWIIATYHPSAVLRAPDAEERKRLRKLFAGDLKLAVNSASRANPGARFAMSDQPIV